ncbi:hypothetical protein QTQ03_28270 [Micromonospora sp. WMMA1363]|uniref:hypothetical protein n=1 Tax=Micromonospora sp. WMMA1363 TaxID=3053985 RepID=UPI00259D061E|nr:hypothetical protein [Micromonospora sp. WMMA1363]MDM4723303.1 hypothetical protein [Micromonospora sp. WMMA1363]
MMDPTGPVARRFPLIARSRPPCTALTARIRVLTALAEQAATEHDLTAAARVCNQAALIASDCAQPDLARTWCHRHARVWLKHPPADSRRARLALEPLINLARLHIRDGDGDTAVLLLDQLFQATRTRTDTVIDGITVPTAALTRAPDTHRELTQWLWSLQLADGTRALTTAGRWNDAETQLRRHRGIGRRMLDGRQVAVIAHAIRGEQAQTQALLDETEPGEPWEAAVTACLVALTRPTGPPPTITGQLALISSYQNVRPDATLVVFRTRLALSIIDAIGGLDHPAATSTALHLIRTVLHAGDGYAARDLLTHACISAGTTEQADALTTVVNRAGLDRPMPTSSASALEAALTTSEALITRATAGSARYPTAVTSAYLSPPKPPSPKRPRTPSSTSPIPSTRASGAGMTNGR